MNKQVEKLIERVRLTPEDIIPYLKNKYAHMYLGNDESWCRLTEDSLLTHLQDEHTELIVDAQLNKVLNDPKLALIDNTPMAKVSYLPVIPLAEALKEVTNEPAH